jgi:hypothetical protein
VEATPFFERLCPAMTNEGRFHTDDAVARDNAMPMTQSSIRPEDTILKPV